MSRHHKLLIFFTFVIGFLTGIFGYFWSHGENGGSSPDAPLEESQTGYELLVTAHGGCERVGCPSFRLLSDGTYSYLAPTRAREYEKYEDTISPRRRDSMDGLVASTDFRSTEQSTFEGVCPVTYDGLAYRFDIRIESERYSFDTCTEALENEPFFVELIRYFGIMEAIHGSSE